MKKYTDIVKAESMYEKVLESRYAEVSILEIDGKPHCIAAWSKARIPEFSDSAELICIHSLCDNWGKGLGSYLLKTVIDKLNANGYHELTVGVEDDNFRARYMYKKQGFTQPIARIKETYQDDSFEYDLLLKMIE